MNLSLFIATSKSSSLSKCSSSDSDSDINVVGRIDFDRTEIQNGVHTTIGYHNRQTKNTRAAKIKHILWTKNNGQH